MQVLVGTCGFAEAQARLFQDFDILEVQKTFYQPPRCATAQRWREAAPPDFIFTVKAWQLITHEAKSPTYRRLTEPLTMAELEQAGAFRWNAVTRMAWEKTQQIADALQAKAIVVQTPQSFAPTEKNLDRLMGFFSQIDRRERKIVFEPRGPAWHDEIIGRLVKTLDLIHGADPFIREPAGEGMRYFRLHGRPAYHYAYRYTDEDLCLLESKLSPAWPNCVLFNNTAMAEDARRFRARSTEKKNGCGF